MTKFDRFTEAYKEMASWARYQPASPGDGFPPVSLTTDEPELVEAAPPKVTGRRAMSLDPERCKRLLELIEHLPDDVKCEIKERLNSTRKNTPWQEEPPVPRGSLLYVPSVGTDSGHLSRYRNGRRIHAYESTWPGG
jgi:hypothetical protein